MTEPAPPRRRFRFSLRTLFVVVTVVCGFLGWLGWNWRIVQERRASFANMVHKKQMLSAWGYLNPPPPAPFPRNLMGDVKVKIIVVRIGCEDNEIDRLRAAYPEAKVCLSEDASDEDLEARFDGLLPEPK